MRRKTIGRILGGALWTVTVTAAVVGVDRACVKTEITGWQQGASLVAVPPQIRFDAIPTYLPDELVWPPQKIYFREHPSAGWWYGLTGKNSGGATNEYPIRLWLGQGELPYPRDLLPFAECMDIVRGGTCPPGWHFFSIKLASGKVLNILSSLELLQTKRIIQALEIQAR